ncbi:MAG: tRNA (N6-isopentenyl adenosine(37)-C2)-methylthiotransferase MiaB [Bacteroidota bacterium]
MSTDPISESKTIDESRQGEAFVNPNPVSKASKKLFLESYGCQMNFSDSEIVASILGEAGFQTISDPFEADVILLNTCAIRENAELKVRQRLNDFKKKKKEKPSLVIGMLGCMAERLKYKLLDEEKLVDLVAGPDSYRDLPKLIETVESGQKAVNVLLSREETYGDISPVRLSSNGVTAFVSITRGCDNMCSFCVVPFTRGRERSRDPESILSEVRDLYENGYREVTLLGQNVDSYIWAGGGLKKEILTEEQRLSAVDFSKLLDLVARISTDLRIRFSTSNPRDMTDDVLHVIAKHENICKYIHLPVQSGSTSVLERMNRGYSREAYMDRIEAIRRIIPGCAVSTDIISGFCGETEEDHNETLSLMEWAEYHFSYMFKYSERPKTLAERQYKDDVPEDIKTRRLTEIVDLQQTLSKKRMDGMTGKVHRVLVEGTSKRSDDMLMGRNTENAVVVFPKEFFKPGDYVDVMAHSCTAATLIGKVVINQ